MLENSKPFSCYAKAFVKIHSVLKAQWHNTDVGLTLFKYYSVFCFQV
jgi:hypothetical protein